MAEIIVACRQCKNSERGTSHHEVPLSLFLHCLHSSRVCMLCSLNRVSINQGQLTRVDIDHKAMDRDAWQVRAMANHVGDFLNVDVYIVKSAEPAHQTV